MIVPRNCRECKLCVTRHKVVVGRGSLDADIFLIGEAPGRYENEQGKPFVGPAGMWLQWMLGYAGITPTDVYITNVVKCRPPKNKDPESDEVEACKGYLVAQIKMIKPKYIVLLGRISAGLFGKQKERGIISYWKKYKIMHLYHPASLCYSGREEKLKNMKQHLLSLRKALVEEGLL